jgi:Zn-dependent protease with chaperone function
LWAIVFGRVPRWYQRSATWLVAYLAQVMAFGCFVTDRLPSRPRKVIALGAWEQTPLPEPPPSPAPLPRLARAGVGLCVLAIAAAAVVAGALLWRTTVPTGLSLPHLDAAKYLDWEVLQNAGPSRTSNRWFAASQLAGLVALSLFAWRGMRWARHSAAGPIGTGVFVAMLGLLCAGLAGAPFLALAVTSMPDTVDSDPAWLIVPLQVVGPLGTAAIAAAVAMGIARKLPRGVWLVAPAALAVLVAGSVVLAGPLLTSGEDKLDDPVLLADARQLAAREGIPNAKIEVIDERDEPGDTRTPTNAFAVGGVGTSEVVLLGSPRTRRQVRVILGHEIGHIARHHTWKAAGWQALFLLLAAGAVGLVLRRRSLYDPRVIPVALLVFSLAALAWRPLDTAASRRYESEADWMALNATRDPKADIDLMEVLALENGAPPRDDGVGRALIDDHPDIMSRIEMAVAWRRLHPARQKKS